MSTNIEEQSIYILAGSNSIFAVDKLLTTPNTSTNQDQEKFDLFALKPRIAYKENVEV